MQHILLKKYKFFSYNLPHDIKPVYNGPSTDDPLLVCALQWIILVPLFFQYFTFVTFFMSHFFTRYIFHVAFFSCCTLFVLHFGQVALFPCCIFCMLHFSCCNFPVLHFFHAALISCFTFFNVIPFFCCTSLVGHSFYVALFSCFIFFRVASCCTFLLLNSFLVALFPQSWTKGQRQIHDIKHNRIFYRMFYN